MTFGVQSGDDKKEQKFGTIIQNKEEQVPVNRTPLILQK